MWPFTRKLQRGVPFGTVLLIDMQERFVSRLEDEKRETLIQAQIAVIHLCAEKDIPLVILEYADFGSTIGRLTSETAKVPRVRIVTKHHNGGFKGTELQKVLKEFKSRSLLLMGINASFCVRKTARGAWWRCYRIMTAADLIADSQWTEGYETSKTMRWYRRNGVLMPSVQQIL